MKSTLFAVVALLAGSLVKLGAEDSIPPPPPPPAPEKPASPGKGADTGAANRRKPDGARARHGMDEIFKHLDTNGDGKISKEEYLKGGGRRASEERFKKMDTNGDGTIDKAELTAAMSKLREGVGRKRGGTEGDGVRKKPDAPNSTTPNSSN